MFNGIVSLRFCRALGLKGMSDSDTLSSRFVRVSS